MNVNEKISGALGLPKDITLDYPKMVVFSNEEVIVENYKGIIEYGDEMIRLNTATHMIKLCGSHIEIKNITQDEIALTGIFTKFEFL